MAQSGIGVHQTVQSFPSSSFHFMLHGAETVFHINDVLLSGDQLLIDCVVPMDILILGQVTDGFIFGKNNISGIRRQFVDDNTQQGGFACTVVADQGCFFPVLYMEAGILKDYLLAKGFADILT